jgi:hypothetical protein
MTSHFALVAQLQFSPLPLRQHISDSSVWREVSSSSILALETLSFIIVVKGGGGGLSIFPLGLVR